VSEPRTIPIFCGGRKARAVLVARGFWVCAKCHRRVQVAE